VTGYEREIIMLVLWLVFMGLFILALAMPLAQRFGYAYGQWGSLRDMLEGTAALVAQSVLFAVFMGFVGGSLLGAGGVLPFALAGEVFSLLVLAVLGTINAVRSLPAHTRFSGYAPNLSE
jgi:hypothetical protein